MGVKKNPSSLYYLSLHQVTKGLLQQWRDTYHNNYIKYSEELKDSIGIVIPYTIYDQIFDLIIDTHARAIQNDQGSETIPSIAHLINSIMVRTLRKLNFNCLRHMGTVKDEEITYLENLLINELPNLCNLVEISLQTSGKDFTLPTCNNEILERIGTSCPKLKSLDISYNHMVTDKGLEYIVPSQSREGCPLLGKITLFECSVTAEGVALLLESLSRLKFLGYRETGQSILSLRKQTSPNSSQKLELAHINNLGAISRTCKDVFKLKCDSKMIDAICAYCPKINGLKVRVSDCEVKFLHMLKSLSILELVFNLGTPSSPGSNTVQFLNLCGTQFVSISFVCDTFSTQYLKVVCEQCNNLKRLWIRCNNFNCDSDITNSDKRKCCLTHLEVFFFRIGCVEYEVCYVPQNVINYVLHKTKLVF